MEALKLIEKTREYLDYLEDHILNVAKAWIHVQEVCSDMDFIQNKEVYRQIDAEVVQHDMSKLSKYELVQYRDRFYSLGPKAELGNAWEHHLSCNMHHLETWRRMALETADPWKVHCVHMIVDWEAMGYRFGDGAKAFYEKNHIKLPEYAVDFAEEIFERL